MTETEWLDYASREAERLKLLLHDYHPVNLTRRPQLPVGRITAPGAEAACEVVRDEVQHNFEGDPEAEFDLALAAGDVNRLIVLLNQAWFGVPESTACWRIPGFREAVALLEDPPDSDQGDPDATT
jgi:hypothetical protein